MVYTSKDRKMDLPQMKERFQIPKSYSTCGGKSEHSEMNRNGLDQLTCRTS